MPDYQKSKIYQIVSPSHPEVPPYYGSTTQTLSSRMSGHKRKYKAGKGTTAKLILCYDDAIILLVENFPCKTKSELLKREGEIIKVSKCCNKLIPTGLNVIDYKNGKIYKIYSPSHQEIDPYYGSTIQTLKKRFSGHKHGNKNKTGCVSNKIMIFEDAIIELVELFPCNNIEELNTREGWWILNNPCINKKNSIPRTQENITQYQINYRNDNKKKLQEYRDNNRIQQRQKNNIKAIEYRQKNRDKINEKQNKKRAEKKDELNEKARKKRIEDPEYREKINKKLREYYYKKKAEKLNSTV
jgi:hypothetical protein